MENNNSTVTGVSRTLIHKYSLSSHNYASNLNICYPNNYQWEVTLHAFVLYKEGKIYQKEFLSYYDYELFFC